MTNDNNRLHNIEKKLDEHGSMLRTIQQTLQAIAVQDQKIKGMQESVSALWRKVDALTDPNNGSLTKIQSHQASCPRGQVKTLWLIVLPMGLTMLAQTAGMIALFIQIANNTGGP